MKIVYFGKGKRGKICLEKILQKNFEVIAIVSETNNDEFYNYAKKTKIKMIEKNYIDSQSFEIKLKSQNADIFILAGFAKILKKNIFKIPKITTINLHGGLLPSYRGASPINWQIINGEKIGGCCIIEIDEGIDTGPILIQKKYQIKINDTHFSILKKTLKIFPNILLKVLGNFEKYYSNKVKQISTKGNYFRKRSPVDSRISWDSMTCLKIYNLIRGMYGPHQWSFSYLNKKKVEFMPYKFITKKILGEPGKISKITNKNVYINCSNGALIIKKVRFNKNIFYAKNFFSVNQKLN